MAEDYPRIDSNDSVREAVEKLLASRWPSGLVIGPEDRLMGAFGRREVLRALSRRTGGFFPEDELGFGLVRGEAFRSEALREVWSVFWKSPVAEVATQKVPSVSESAPLEAVARLLAEGVDIVAVLRGSRVVGAVDPCHALRGMSAEKGESRGSSERPPGARRSAPRPVASFHATRQPRSPRRRGQTSATKSGASSHRSRPA